MKGKYGLKDTQIGKLARDIDYKKEPNENSIIKKLKGKKYNTIY